MKDRRISVSTEKLLNLGEYREKVEFLRVPKTVRTSTENGRISVSTGKLLHPGQYRQKVESVRVPKNCPDQFGKMVESV